MSQTKRDLAHAVKIFKDVLGLDPVEQTTFDGGRYAIYNLTTDLISTDGTTSDWNMQYGQVQLWERDDAKSGSYSPAWFEEYVEEATFTNYTTSSETCWTIWRDNHFTFYDVPEAYIYKVVARYKELELPFKEFRIPVGDKDLLFSAHFMLPGGRWFEVHPKDSGTKATANAELWDGDYCYTQSCR